MTSKQIDGALQAPFDLKNKALEAMSARVRKSVFEVCLAAENGHIGGSLGAVELLCTLYFGGILRFNPEDAYDDRRDRVLIRGHLGPVRYSILSEIGFISEEELKSYRRLGSRLQGHEDHAVTPGVDITPSGSLGMVLSYGVGAAVVARHVGATFRTFVFIGDGEEQEGNISEAARHAARLGLNNLVAVIDANGKQLSDPISSTDASDTAAIWMGYGWEVIVLEDGHNIQTVRKAYLEAVKRLERSKPVLIIASTVKGKGMEGAEGHFSGFHTLSVCSKTNVSQGLDTASQNLNGMQEAELVKKSGGNDSIHYRPQGFKKLKLDLEPSSYEGGLGKWQGRYFQGFRALLHSGEDPIFFLTADVTRKDIVDEMGLKEFLLYDNVGLREQHLLAYSHGISLTMPSSRVIVNSFDAFMYRGLDQLHAMMQGGGSAVILGDYSGLTNARNGSTHQTSAQPGALMVMPKVTFLEPWDSVDLFGCLNWALGESRGVVYIRLHSGSVQDHARHASSKSIDFNRIYGDESDFDITVVSSGITTGHCLEAAKQLRTQGVSVQVLNIVDHKSLSESFVSMLPHGKPVLTVYNGASRFLQSNVSAAVMSHPVRIPSRILGIGFEIGTTGHLDDLMRHYGLDAEGVMRSVRSML